MAATLASTLSASLGWDFQDALDLATVKDTSSLAYTKALATGTGSNLADRIWHDSRAIASGANDDLDLTALTQSIFGDTTTIAFVQVKGILIVNTSTTAGDELILDSSVANAYKGLFNGSATSKVEIGPDSALLISAKQAGFASSGTVSGTNKVIRVSNPGGGTSITYKIAILGTSA